MQLSYPQRGLKVSLKPEVNLQWQKYRAPNTNEARLYRVCIVSVDRCGDSPLFSLTVDRPTKTSLQALAR